MREQDRSPPRGVLRTLSKISDEVCYKKLTAFNHYLFLKIYPSHMIDRVLITTLPSKKERIFPALVEVFLLEKIVLSNLEILIS